MARSRRIAAAACWVPTLALVLTVTGPAGPAGGQPQYPTEDELEDARLVEDAATGAVAAVERRLAAVTARLDELAWSAARAAEDYNGARLALAEARAAERAAARTERSAAVAAELAWAELGRIAAASYRAGGQFATAGLVLEADGADDFFDRAAALRTVTRSQNVVYERAVDASADAAAAAADAERALAVRRDAAQEAEQAYQAAEATVAEHEALITATEREHAAVLAELAAARGTTVALEQERQAGLAAERAAERERRARTAADPDAADDVVRQPVPSPSAAEDEPGPGSTTASAGATAAPSPTTAAAPSGSSASAGSAAPSATAPAASSLSPARSSATPPPTPSAVSSPLPSRSSAAPAPSTTAPSTSSPAPAVQSSGADRAIAYARAQLGKPYQWGAAGPNAFDCSGLTMRAWEQGGKQLPHWSVAQARMTTRVSYAALRPGDLIFWSDNGQPSGTYHVALYIGAGKMIHAPRPGKTVEIQSVFYWRTPSFYGRV